MTLDKSLLVMSILAVLIGCGGGSSNGTITDPPAPPVSLPESHHNRPNNTISGHAADGYLQYATVCLDLNNNALCDTEEPSTTTGEGGKFELVLTDDMMTNLASYRLVVEATAGITIDEDDGHTIKRSFILQAPMNTDDIDQQFISPITSVTRSLMDIAGLSKQQAADQIAAALGIEIDVLKNHVAASENAETDIDSAAYQKLYRIAQVLANAQAVAEEAWAQQSSDQTIYKEVLNAIYRRFWDLSGLVSEAVNQTMASNTFDPTEVIQQLNLGQRLTIRANDLSTSHQLASELLEGPAEDPWSGASAIQDLYLLNFQQIDNKIVVSQDHWFVDRLDLSGAADDDSDEYAHYVVTIPQVVDVGLYSATIADTNDSYWVWSSESNAFEPFNMAVKGYVTGRKINMINGSPNRIFNTVKVDAEYRESTKTTSIAEVMETLYPGQVNPELYKTVAGDLINSGSNYYIGVKETLLEDLYLGQYNGYLCNEGDVVACNFVPNKVGSDRAESFDDVIHMSLPVSTASAIAATYSGKLGYGVQLIADGRAVLRNTGVADDAPNSIVATGTWEKVTSPFTHIRIKLPAGFSLAVGNTGFAQGTPILFDMGAAIVAGEYFQKGLTVGDLTMKPQTQLLVNDPVRTRLLNELVNTSNLIPHPDYPRD